MRSVVVVLPASMWAMIPIFRVRPSGYSRMTRPPPLPDGCCWRSFVTCATSATSSSNLSAGTATFSSPLSQVPGPQGARLRSFLRCSPSVVGERAVGVRHLVEVLTALDRRALPVGRVHDLRHEALAHRVLPALTREVHEPPQGERRSPGRTDLDRHLVARATDAPALDLEQRAGVLHGLLERDDRVVRRAFADLLERLVHNALGGRLLPVQQDLVDQLRHERVLVDGIRLDLTPDRRSLPWHPDDPLRRVLLGAVLRPGLAAVPDPGGVERGTN